MEKEEAEMILVYTKEIEQLKAINTELLGVLKEAYLHIEECGVNRDIDFTNRIEQAIAKAEEA